MQFSVAAVLALAASAAAFKGNGTHYVTEVVTAVTTYCPVPTEVVAGGKTYTVTSATTLTITDCASGCTVTKPVFTSKVVDCKNCNGTVPTKPSAPTKTGVNPVPVPVGTGSATVSKPPSAPTAGAAKVALSGAGLAGLVGFAALL